MDERSNDAGGGVPQDAVVAAAHVAPPISLAPPTTPGAFRIPDRPKTWPTTLGVISIVFGALGFLASVWGVIGPLLMGPIIEATGMSGPSPIDGAIAFTPYLAGLSGCAALLAILLGVGGAGLLKRRPWAPRAVHWWAWLRILLVVAMSATQYLMQSVMFEGAMTSSSGGGSGGGLAAIMFGDAALLVGVVLGVAWGWALPIFMLIWLQRPSVRAEIATWPRRAVA